MWLAHCNAESSTGRVLRCVAVPAPAAVLDAIHGRFDATIDELIALARIPGVSAAGFDPAGVERMLAGEGVTARHLWALTNVELWLRNNAE